MSKSSYVGQGKKLKVTNAVCHKLKNYHLSAPYTLILFLGQPRNHRWAGC